MASVPHPVAHPAPIPWGRAGLKLIPLTVVGVLLLVAGAVAMGTRTVCGGGNESSAISTLRNIANGQLQFRAGGHVDEDGDGEGEYGGFLDLSGMSPPRGADAPINPPVLSGAFRTVHPDGTVRRSGYHFRMWLVGSDGWARDETPSGFAAGAVDVDSAETTWVCYAWPAAPQAGDRAFVVDADGNIYATRGSDYVGSSAPDPGAAFPSGGLRCISGTIVPDVPAQDGNVWARVN